MHKHIQNELRYSFLIYYMGDKKDKEVKKMLSYVICCDTLFLR